MENDFSSLFQTTSTVTDTSYINATCDDNVSFITHISMPEFRKTINSVNKGKASGIDNIPVEVLNNDTAFSFLHV